MREVFGKEERLRSTLGWTLNLKDDCTQHSSTGLRVDNKQIRVLLV